MIMENHCGLVRLGVHKLVVGHTGMHQPPEALHQTSTTTGTSFQWNWQDCVTLGFRILVGVDSTARDTMCSLSCLTRADVEEANCSLQE